MVQFRISKHHGPVQDIKQISKDQLKLLRRGLAWGIKPTYGTTTLQEAEGEMRRRGMELKKL